MPPRSRKTPCSRKSLGSALLLAAATLAAPLAQASGDAAAGKTKSAQCAACHGEDGTSTNEDMYPHLAGQYADYIAKALKDYQTGARQNPIMAPFVQELSDQDRADIAAWFSSQPGSLRIIDYAQ